MAKSTSSKKKSVSKKSASSKKKKKKTSVAKKKSTASSKKKSTKSQGPVPSVAEVRKEAKKLEEAIETELLRDAVLSARVALEDLRADTHARPFERRRGIRLREKALKVERAFNRLRALRKGELLPERHPDD